MGHLKEAVRILENSRDVRIKKISSVYETEPVGGVVQENFYNIVVEVGTDLLPQDLLDLTQAIEDRLKRQRDVHWGPRTIDIDILLYDDMVIAEDNLTVPHPEMNNRAFVLVPLLEIEPDLKLPDGSAAHRHLEKVLEQRVEKIGSLI